MGFNKSDANMVRTAWELSAGLLSFVVAVHAEPPASKPPRFEIRVTRQGLAESTWPIMVFSDLIRSTHAEQTKICKLN